MDQSKQYDLEKRTFDFAQKCRYFVKKLPSTIILRSDCDQLVRSSGSVGANYIEANESLGKKDFSMKIKICRKEAKESSYWLELIETENSELEKIKILLIQESIELVKIFSSILKKVSIN